MPDDHDRPDAPLVAIFTLDELLILREWFGVQHPPSERWVLEVLDEYDRSVEDTFYETERSTWDILDEWGISKEIERYERIDAAVAQILLERVQERLPQWAAVTDDGVQLARPILDRRAERKVELLPRHLLTINWANSGPGFDWPVSYHVTYVPRFNRTVVTASGDCPEAFGDTCDIALGHFGTETTLLEGSGEIIRGNWANHCIETEQQRWVEVVRPGLVSEAEANAWADEVWLDRDDDDPD